MLGIRGEGAQAASNVNGPLWNETERTQLEANIAARKPFLDFVYSRRNADGSQQYFQVSGEPIFDSTGGYTGYRGIGMDITTRVRSSAN
jgi:PAS domain S-box-containing protein